MKIFIEIPTWLGDAVMTTPAIENILKNFDDVELTVFGSFVSTKLFLNHPNVKNIIIDDSKNSSNRYIVLFKSAKSFGKFDFAFSFRSSFTTKFLLFFIDAKKKFYYKKERREIHQVIKYNNFINKALNINYEPNDLKIYTEKKKYDKPTLGLNPGATYGSAKRWYPEEFAKVAIALSDRYDIIIFGGPGEIDIANDIEKMLLEKNISNFQNLAGKTSISELIKYISGLKLFITNDSGPMHVAAAFKVTTIAIFGPTKYTETNQWNNPNGKIVSKNLECAPCMKRVCPFKHHDCMKLITAQNVLEKIDENI